MTPPAPVARHDWRTVLGLSDGDVADISEIRAAQLSAIQRYTLPRLAIELGATLLLFLSLHGHAGALLWGWAGTTAFAAVAIAGGRYRSRSWRASSLSRRELHDETLRSIFMGALWAVPPVLFAGAGGIEQQLSLWTITVALMAASALLLAPVPLATILFVAMLTVSLAAMMLLIDLPLVSAACLGLGVLLVACCLASGRNFLMRKQAELQLSDRDEVVSLLLREFDDGDADWLWQIDASRSLTHVSPRLAFALGEEAMALEGRPFLQMLAGDSWDSGDFPPALRTLADRLKQRESFSNLVLPVTLRGVTRWWELSASPRHDETGLFIGFRGVGSDVTAERQTSEKINHLARFDPLTGLPNRLQVTEALAQALADADQWRSKCAFMMIDLDRFKAVNDTLGHQIGDRLLSRVSERLRALMTPSEVCGRLGGDEFGVVLRDASDPAKILRLGKAIIHELSRPYEVDQHTLYIGASVGTAIGPRDGRSVEMLIRSADLALYRSKDAGGGHYHAYEPQLHAHAEERRVIEIALRKALEKGEMHLCYQPVVSADDASLTGFEALLRWTHPEMGVISPAKFVAVAEEARLIAPIGEWVLRTACEEAAKWPSDVRVAVNVSTEQLHDTNFVTSVISALAHSGLSPHRLELEVTESVFMREGSGAIAVLGQILDLGIHLSLDDFGTGYSSLGYLSRTRFSTIKIDRSFVQGAARNAPESLAIIRAIVAMADSLNMTTTAEGVETEEEYLMVRRLGCRKIQGYLFGRPMVDTEARKLFSTLTRSAA